MEEEKTKKLNQRPISPKQPVQCPWCVEQRPLRPGALSQHVKKDHPAHWQGNIYSSLPADFDYGNGPLDPKVRAMLIQYSEYARKSYARIKAGRTAKRIGRPRKSLSAMRRGQLGGLARARKAEQAKVAQEQNGLVPRINRSVKYCPHCGWNIDAMQKAQAFVDGRAL